MGRRAGSTASSATPSRRDIIGAKDFRPFLPLLFTLFTMILLNNLFGHHPVRPVPHDEPDRLPARADDRSSTSPTTRSRSSGSTASSATSSPWCRRACRGWLRPILFVLEFLTYFVIRPLTLALRLFGNMLAGHLMLLVFIVGGEYLLLHGGNGLKAGRACCPSPSPSFMTFFELLIEFLQAFIFTLLAALYISDAVSEHH
jgi:F-type H+-transporting ATPase subunit a